MWATKYRENKKTLYCVIILRRLNVLSIKCKEDDIRHEVYSSITKLNDIKLDIYIT